MSLWRKPTDVDGPLKRRLYEELLDETLLTDHVKTECYLLVALGVRPCSLVTIPAEFPHGDELGREIDLLCEEDLQRVIRAPTEEKALLVPRLKSKIRESFKKVVFSSNAYKAHISLSRKLSLQTLDIEVRPSIHELYVFRDAAVQKQLKRLIALRTAARTRLMSLKSVPNDEISLAYAEELSADYLSCAGKLLGYPPCCTEAYINDRIGGGLNVETRASVQLKRLDDATRQQSVYAYFARNFFPCQPACQSAAEIGKSAFRLLTDANSRLGAVYFDCVKGNALAVEEYPELAIQYKQQMEKRVRDG